MPPDMMARYVALKNGLEMDQEIRNRFKISPKKYYSVSYNSHNYGAVIEDNTRTRFVESTKISKSDQK